MQRHNISDEINKTERSSETETATETRKKSKKKKARKKRVTNWSIGALKRQGKGGKQKEKEKNKKGKYLKGKRQKKKGANDVGQHAKPGKLMSVYSLLLSDHLSLWEARPRQRRETERETDKDRHI